MEQKNHGFKAILGSMVRCYLNFKNGFCFFKLTELVEVRASMSPLELTKVYHIESSTAPCSAILKAREVAFHSSIQWLLVECLL